MKRDRWLFATVMQKTALFYGKGNIIKAIYWIDIYKGEVR